MSGVDVDVNTHSTSSDDFGTFLRSTVGIEDPWHTSKIMHRASRRAVAYVLFRILFVGRSKGGIHSIPDPREDDFLNVFDPRGQI